jgi:hypothetical protein
MEIFCINLKLFKFEETDWSLSNVSETEMVLPGGDFDWCLRWDKPVSTLITCVYKNNHNLYFLTGNSQT